MGVKTPNKGIANLKPFKPGQSGNPGGRPKTSPTIKAFKETTYEQFIDALQRFGSLTAEEFKEELTNRTMTQMEKVFARIVDDAAMGKEDARKLLLERLFGKVRENFDLNFTHKFEQLPPAQLAELGEAAIKVLKAAESIDAEIIEEAKLDEPS